MASENRSYPRISERAWWKLRDRFKQSIPAVVTPDYLASVIGDMKPNSARQNILPPLRMMALIDENGVPTERARQWRVDDSYPKVCEEILSELYPSSLLDAFVGSNPARTQVENWFFSASGKGQGAAQQMASTFLLLLNANVAENIESGRTKSNTAKPQKAKPKASSPSTSRSKNPESQDLNFTGDTGNSSQGNTSSSPTLHIDLQIHITPDVTGEQIDQIFASMAKHLYGNRKD